jgi:hypothetical protein
MGIGGILFGSPDLMAPFQFLDIVVLLVSWDGSGETVGWIRVFWACFVDPVAHFLGLSSCIELPTAYGHLNILFYRDPTAPSIGS